MKHPCEVWGVHKKRTGRLKDLPLTPRQAAALKTALDHLLDGKHPPELDELSALREVAGKLDTLREK